MSKSSQTDVRYDPKHDSCYDPEALEWLEDCCDDPECCFCSARPPKPTPKNSHQTISCFEVSD